MKRVYKYPIIVDEYFSLELPIGAKILTVDAQDNCPYLWVLVNPENISETRRFRFAGTGHNIIEDGDYIGTVQIRGFVWHIFEIAP